MMTTANPESTDESARLECALEVGSIAWWEMDCGTGNVWFHRRKTDMLGYEPEAFTHYTHFTALLHPDDLEPAMQAMRDHLSGARPEYRIEYRLQARSGAYRWFQDVGRISQRDEAGRPATVTGLVMDITNRRLTEEALSASEQRFRQMFHGHSAIKLVLDATTGDIVDANLAAEHFYQPVDFLAAGDRPGSLGWIPSATEVRSMAIGRREEKQQPMWIGAGELPQSPGHRFYAKLNELLAEARFDARVEGLCAAYYEDAGTPGRRSIPPGVYFRMLFIGYFEGIESERGICWRCADSLSLRDFLNLLPSERVPEHTTLSRIRTRLPETVYEQVFQLVLEVVKAKGLLRGKVTGVDSTYLRADASMKAIVRREDGQTYREYLQALCRAEGIEEPTAEDCRRLDRKRKGKKTSNTEWKSRTDGDARIAKLKDGRTRLAYKAEHVVDMETGVVLAAEIYEATASDTSTLTASLEAAKENTQQPPSNDDDSDNSGGTTASTATPRPKTVVVADKGYHKAELLLDLKKKGYVSYVSVPKCKGERHWADKGGYVGARAFYANRDRTQSKRGKAFMRRRGELIERTFAHLCETGATRRIRVRGTTKVRKVYLMQVAALNLGAIMRKAFGQGTPRGMGDAQRAARAFWALLWPLWTLWTAVSSPTFGFRSSQCRFDRWALLRLALAGTYDFGA